MVQTYFKYYDEKKAAAIARKIGKKGVTEMAFNIANLGIVDKGELLKSLRVSVKKSEFGEVSGIQFSYLFYGKFFENGAKNLYGKGTKLEKKPWRNPTLNPLWEESNKEFATYYKTLIEEEIAQAASEALDSTIKINL